MYFLPAKWRSTRLLSAKTAKFQVSAVQRTNLTTNTQSAKCSKMWQWLHATHTSTSLCICVCVCMRIDKLRVAKKSRPECVRCIESLLGVRFARLTTTARPLSFSLSRFLIGANMAMPCYLLGWCGLRHSRPMATGNADAASSERKRAKMTMLRQWLQFRDSVLFIESVLSRKIR